MNNVIHFYSILSCWVEIEFVGVTIKFYFVEDRNVCEVFCNKFRGVLANFG
jgi:hypothetical protein